MLSNYLLRIIIFDLLIKVIGNFTLLVILMEYLSSFSSLESQVVSFIIMITDSIYIFYALSRFLDKVYEKPNKNV